MRVLAFSDSHGDRGRLREAVEQALRKGPADVCVHCGDGARDLAAVEAILRDRNPETRLYAVRGNGDIGDFALPTLELFEVNGVRMVAVHGHLLGVKSELDTLVSFAQVREARVAFFGHTHKPFLEAVRGITLLNPGSIAYQLRGNTAYGQVLVEADGRVRADLIPWAE